MAAGATSGLAMSPYMYALKERRCYGSTTHGAQNFTIE